MKWALINVVQRKLGKFSKFQQKHYVLLSLVFLIFTGFMFVGATKMTVESDFSKFDPEGLPVTDLNKEVVDQFSTSDGIVIIAQLNPDTESQDIYDIRDPEVIEYLKRLEENVLKEQFIDEAFSIASFFDENPESINDVKTVLDSIPVSRGLVSSDYSFTVMFIEANIGNAAEQIEASSNRLAQVVKDSSPPADIVVEVTGEPALGTKLFNFVVEDARIILLLSILFIFILLIITEMSWKKALMAIIPLLFGLIWTAGTLGWLDIPITVATAGLSAMILGLGVEYSIFLIERYKEERQHHGVDTAISNAVENVGASIFSSGGTTAIGFFALSLSLFPILAGLGQSLGIGILMLFGSTILITPLVILYEDKLIKRVLHKKIARTEGSHKSKFNLFLDKRFRAYGKVVSRRPWLFIIIAGVLTFFIFQGVGLIEQEEFDFENVLPEDLPELQAFTLLENEFGGTSSARLYVFLDPLNENNGITDIRDPRVLPFIDQLTQGFREVIHVERVDSVTNYVREENNNRITITRNDARELLSRSPGRDLINDDYSGTIIDITLRDEAGDDPDEFVRQGLEVIETSLPPPGVKAVLVGGLAVEQEQLAVVNPDSARTSIIAFAVIIIFLFILTGSVKKTFLPLLTVVLAILWTLGLSGWLRVPFNPITTSVITMTIGIGIDFGIQLVTRFDFELRNNEKIKAMENSLSALLTPMFITVIAAVIGFRSMNLGRMQILADLGTTMSLAVASSMIVTVTGVAALMLVFTRTKNLGKAYKINK